MDMLQYQTEKGSTGPNQKEFISKYIRALPDTLFFHPLQLKFVTVTNLKLHLERPDLVKYRFPEWNWNKSKLCEAEQIVIYLLIQVTRMASFCWSLCIQLFLLYLWIQLYLWIRLYKHQIFWNRKKHNLRRAWNKPAIKNTPAVSCLDSHQRLKN